MQFGQGIAGEAAFKGGASAETFVDQIGAGIHTVGIPSPFEEQQHIASRGAADVEDMRALWEGDVEP